MQSEVLNLPKSRTAEDEGTPFPNYVQLKLREYRDLILKLDNFIIDDSDNFLRVNHNDLVKHLVTRINIGINKTIINYYNGKPAQAYNELDRCLSNNPSPIENISAYLSFVVLALDQKLFRIRSNKFIKHYRKKDLFHVPFEKGEIITTKRFSIAGGPSLYLSNSIYTALKDMRIKNINHISASRFQLNSDFCNWRFRLLDLSNRVEYFRKKYVQDQKTIDGPIIKFLVSWPLILVSSLKVQKSNYPFVPEYIIPQLLLQWIRSNGNELEGIKYSSSHIALSNKNNHGNFFNIVIPCKDVMPKGYCSYLKKLFKMTEPKHIGYYYYIKKLFNWIVPIRLQSDEKSNLNDFEINTFEKNGNKIKYCESEYGNFEMRLINSKADLLEL